MKFDGSNEGFGTAGVLSSFFTARASLTTDGLPPKGNPLDLAELRNEGGPPEVEESGRRNLSEKSNLLCDGAGDGLTDLPKVRADD